MREINGVTDFKLTALPPNLPKHTRTSDVGVEIPDVEKVPIGEAEQIFAWFGLNVEKKFSSIIEEFAGSLSVDDVSSQEPAVGFRAPRGSTVHLIVVSALDNVKPIDLLHHHFPHIPG